MIRETEDTLQNRNIIKITQDFHMDEDMQIGRGKFGTVYKGYSTSRDQLIAVKFVPKSRLNNQYEREIVVLNDVAGFEHPSIMGYYGHELNEKGLYLFLELCTGGTLKEFIKEGISELKIVSLFQQLLSAMAFMNSKKKVHRDLKPENIFLNDMKHVKVGDFGVSRELGRQMTKLTGTALYGAPEVFEQRDPTVNQYTQKCDVWSAGLILYEMLVKKQLFHYVRDMGELRKQYQRLKNNELPIRIPDDKLPEWLPFLKKMIVYSQANRSTFAQLKADFEPISKKMKEKLKQRYGYQNIEQQQYEYIKLTRSQINPYESYLQESLNPNTITMSYKLKEQQSYSLVNSARNWCNFQLTKSQFMLSLFAGFNRCKYDVLRNVYKFVLMYLSVSAYLARVGDMLRAIEKMSITTFDATVSQDEIVERHQKYFKELMQEMAVKYKKQISIYTATLKKNIIKPLTQKYLQRPQDKATLQTIPTFLTLLSDPSPKSLQTYLTLYSKVLQLPEVHFTTQAIRASEIFTPAYLRVYAYMRLVLKFQELFPDKYYRNDDYLKLMKEEFENKNREELLAFVDRFNQGS